MNWLEQMQGAVGGIWLIGGVLAAAALITGAVALTLMIARHNRRLGARVARLETELTVYTEASTRVAESLEAVLMGRTRTSHAVQTSRRYLLLQARERLHRGESAQGIARGLGLSHDEVRLLEQADRRGRMGAPVQSPGVDQSRIDKQAFARPVSVELPRDADDPRIPRPDQSRLWNLAGQ